jgi:aminoglycoside phosphotransferase family enzyme/predicted kinase
VSDSSATTEASGSSRLADQARLVSALHDAAMAGAKHGRVELIETHISYVILTGQFAYKIKKALELGFLDFRSLAARRFYCEEELRLNRRLAPTLYLEVVPITGSIELPVMGGTGPVIEYAVKMREFPQEALASRAPCRGELSAADVDTLAAKVAAFHRTTLVARNGKPFGAPDDVLRIARQNFTQMRPLLVTPAETADLDSLAAWTDRQHANSAASMALRRSEGFVRECHGDLHFGNIAVVDGELTIFDCIEFNEEMRWIDVMSEVAFVVMDLHDRGRPDFAHRFLNAYLEITGDYDGLNVLRFYLVYRAMVRAKVSRLRVEQLASTDAKAVALSEYRGYMAIAMQNAQPPHPAIVITHGLAGSGKTTLSQALLELIGAVRIRTDVERKRLHGVPAVARDRDGIDAGLYSSEATRETYQRTLQLGRAAAAAGFRVIVDAGFQKCWQRKLFRNLASELGVPFAIVDFVAESATMRERVAARQHDPLEASDADLAVLEHQMRTQEPLQPDELSDTFVYDAQQPLADARLPQQWRGALERLAASPSAGVAKPGLPAEGADPGLATKVAFLSRPESYPQSSLAVRPVETHMSWLFLTDRYAYKLKKPVHFSYLDFRTEALRRHNCSEEVRLNRRLSDGVYFGTVPLTVDASGRLSFGSNGFTVDWLVHMRRLPADRMLDTMIRNKMPCEDDLSSILVKLSRFYRDAAKVGMTPETYRGRFAAGIAENLRELCCARCELPRDLVEAICERQRAVLGSQAILFDQRVHAGRVIEAHGDLRPEHICLEPAPQIIDCLEFSRDFRLLDPVDELGFLALECERLGAPGLRSTIAATYAEVTGDSPADRLIHFYQSYRACVRAKIAVWHLNDPVVKNPHKWPAQAQEYLRLARGHIDHCE